MNAFRVLCARGALIAVFRPRRFHWPVGPLSLARWAAEDRQAGFLWCHPLAGASLRVLFLRERHWHGAQP
ncbi:hypothetical protein BF17_00140 (plasmid) [Yersinia similis]|uniref:Uncharacterized protein n=1 Tax=Yersinia similis TaxID=367190 RepID=A0ABN4CYU9_9GAMM|nr:hypothetical protein BF17_00140 [Yersinia similis]CFQ66853.1 Uncharacterised protein [Yersinia similis]